MASTTLPTNKIAVANTPGLLHMVDHVYVWSGAANVDGNTIEIAKLPPRATIANVVIRSTDMGTTISVSIGLNPGPGGTTAVAAALASGLTGFATTAGDFNQLALPPTVTAGTGAITAGAGLKTHETLESILYLTLVDAGETTTTGSLYTQVFYTLDSNRSVNLGVNA